MWWPDTTAITLGAVLADEAGVRVTEIHKAQKEARVSVPVLACPAA